jgi:hypothetical protein
VQALQKEIATSDEEVGAISGKSATSGKVTVGLKGW